MAKGLSEQWGVASPKASGGGSSQQRDAFAAAFSGALQGLTGSLDYTVKNTELTSHQPLAGGRDTVCSKYNQVLGQIDPEDDAKAAGAIDAVMKLMRSLGEKAQEIKQRTEDELAKWTDCTGDLDEASDQIDELDAWGVEIIDKLLADRGLVDAEAAKRRWKEATDKLRGLRESLKPVYDEYLRQKEAKEKYEPDRTGFDGDFDPLSRYEEATEAINDLAKQIAEGLSDVADRVTEKDYVNCNDLLNGLKGVLKRLQEAIDEQEALKAKYESGLSGVLNRDYEAPESKPGTPGHQLQTDVVNLEDNMKAAAEACDYENALILMDELEAKNAEAKAYFVELAVQEAAYDTKLGELSKRIDAAMTDIPPHLDPEFPDLSGSINQIEEAASMEQYKVAMALIGTFESEIAVFETLIGQHREDKAEFEAHWPPVLAKVTQTVAAIPPELEAALAEFNVVLDQVSQPAAEEDFATALANIPGLENAHLELVELLELYKAYKSRMDAVLVRATAVSADLPLHIQPRYQSVDSALGQAEQAAGNLSFEMAISYLDLAEAETAFVETLLEQHCQQQAQFEEGWPSLLDKVTQTVQSTPPALESEIDGINAHLEQIEQAEGAQNFGAALGCFGPLEAERLVLEQKIAHYQAQKTDYEERKADVEGEMKKTKGAVPKSYQDEKGHVEKAKSEADASGEKGEFDKGTKQLDQTKQKAVDLETKVTELEAQKSEYQTAHAALDDLLSGMEFPSEYPMLKDGCTTIVKRKAEAAKAAASEDYVTALDCIVRATAMAEGHAKELPVYQQQEADYIAKSTMVKNDVGEAGKDLPADEKAKAYYKSVKDAVAIMEGEAKKLDFPAALSTLSQIENGLTTLATFKEKEKQKEDDYNKRADTLKGAFDEATKSKEQNENLAGMQDRMGKKHSAMTEAGDKRDFDAALALLGELEAMVEGYGTLKADIDEERKIYNDRRATLTPRLAETQPPIPGDMAKSILNAIQKNKAKMEAGVAKEVYDDALEAMDWVEASLAAYEKLKGEHDKLKSEYDKRAGALAGGLAEVAKPVSHMALKMPRDKIFGKQQAMQTAGGAQDYAAAIAALDWLEPAVADYLTLQNAMENAEEEYKKRYDTLRSSLDAAADPAEYPEAEESQGKIAAARAAMEKAAETEDFENALGQIVVLAADVSAYESLVQRLFQQEEEFSSRWSTLKGPLSEGMKTEIIHRDLKGMQQRLEPRRVKVEEAENNRDFAVGLTALTELEAHFEGFKTMLADIEEEKRTYETRLAGLSESLKMIDPPLDGKMATSILNAIAHNKNRMETVAAAHDFDEALDAMDWVETSLTAYAELLDNEKALEDQYNKGADTLRAKLSKMNFPAPYPILEPVGAAITEKIGQMEQEATQKNFEAAIDSLNRATATADGYAKELETLKKQEADYRAGHAAVKPRLQAVAKAKPSDPKAQGLLKSITEGYKGMKDLAAKHDYKEALSYLTQLSGSLATLETFLAETEANA